VVVKGPRSAAVVLLLAGLGWSLPGSAGARPAGAIEQVPAAWANYAHVHRRRSAIRVVVVHVTESSFTSTVAWFRNPRAGVSAHYVVGRDGQVVHMVPDDEIAWHAGNHWYNAHSIGVEDEGIVEVPGTFTDAEYRASASLVAGLLRRYGIPADRRHVIGHNQVPDPYRPWLHGGYDHHTDPGPSWDWTRYMSYVRSYLAGRTPPPPALDVSMSGVELDQEAKGTLDLTADVTGELVSQVQFLLDGEPLATVTEPPYTLQWNSAYVANGRHVLAVRAIGEDGRVAYASVVVYARNAATPPPLVTSIGLDDGATVSGTVQLTPVLAGGPVARVELWVDGTVVETATAAPWTLAWDSSTVAPGTHTVAVRAVGPRGAASAKVIVVTVVPPP
jgi:N-acetylmuramoyl-L-alanine amidase-like protein/Big-like domain-containing protein